jgi:hypothetical protein
MQQQIDTRLIAAVQRSAGAHCHEAAGLLQHYEYVVRLGRAAEGGGNLATEQLARERVNAAEADLRRFLFRCRAGAPGGADQVWSHCAPGEPREYCVHT